MHSYMAQNIFLVHNLIHFCDDVRLLGPLDKYSAFKYENFIKKIKKKVKTSNKPLQQFVNRIHEENQLKINPEQREYPIVKFSSTGEDGEGRRFIKSVEYENFFLSTKTSDNCVLLCDDNIIAVNRVFLRKNKILLYGKKYRDSKLFFDKPCDSSDVGINVVNEERNEFFVLEDRYIKQKCLKLPINERDSEI